MQDTDSARGGLPGVDSATDDSVFFPENGKKARKTRVRRLSSQYWSTMSSVCSQLSQRSRSIRHQPREGASCLATAIILANVILGAGLLNFPKAYADAGGFQIAIPTHITCIVFIFLGMVFLANCAEETGTPTIQAMIHHYCGAVALLLTNLVIIIHNFGTCVTFLIVIGDQVDEVMSAIVGDTFCNYWYLGRNFTLPIISIIFVYPLCFVKNIENFNVISYLGMLTVVYTVFFVFWECFGTDEYRQDLTSLQVPMNDWLDMFKVIPTLLFSYEVHIEVVPMYHAMKKPSVRNFTNATIITLIMTTAVYGSVGVVGYLTFGFKLSSDIITNYRSSDVLVIIAMIMQALKAVTTFPIVLYCTRLVMDDIIEGFQPGRWSETKRRYGATTVMFFASLAIAVLVPSIGSVITLLGISGVIFVFVFPGLTHLGQFVLWRGSCWRATNSLGGCLLIIIGAFVIGVLTVQITQRFQSGEFSHGDVVCKPL